MIKNSLLLTGLAFLIGCQGVDTGVDETGTELATTCEVTAEPTAEEMAAMEASAVQVTREAFDALTGGATTQLEGCQYWTICNESPRFDGGAETNGECPDGHIGEDKYLCCTTRFNTQCCWGSSRPYSCDAGGGPISPNNPPSAPVAPEDDRAAEAAASIAALAVPDAENATTDEDVESMLRALGVDPADATCGQNICCYTDHECLCCCAIARGCACTCQ